MVLEQVKIVDKEYGKVIVKKFLDLSSLKWLISLPFKPFYPFTLLAEERLKREHEFFTSNHSNFKTPKVYFVDWKGKTLEREFIEGEKLSEVDIIEATENLAKTLANIHKEGWCLGDSKPSNFIRSCKEIYVVDGEQAIRSFNKSYMVWDLVILLLFLSFYKPLKATVNYMEILHRFSEKYLEVGGDLKILNLTLKFLDILKVKGQKVKLFLQFKARWEGDL